MSQNMQRTEVRISARDFFELLAGEITSDQFFARHNFLKDKNPFAQALRSGRMMKAVRRIPDVHIEITPEDDDDWLVFTFEGPDPAISSFIPPRKKTD